MDVLTDVLSTFELKGWLSSRRELEAPWRYDFAASKDSMFHVLSYGRAYLEVEGDNHAARTVYHRLGFADGYAYHYRARDPAAH